MLHCTEYAPPAIDRRFWSIFLVSIAIHAGVLAWNHAEKLQQPELPPLVASLRAMTPAPLSPSETLVEALPVQPQQKIPPQAARRESPSKPVLATAAGAADNAPLAPVVAPVAISEGAPAPQASPVPMATPALATPTQEDVLANYRRRLSDLLARQQDYPRIAAMRGWEGEVRVRVRIARKGSLIGVTLDSSSGYEILDKHALAMLEGLGSLPAFPEGFSPGELQVVVPVTYLLRKPT